MKNTPKNIDITKLHPFEGHPFKVQDNDEMNSLIESIQVQGILSPLIVRPKENTTDEYEIISGHRRFRAATKAEMKEIPAIILPLDRDVAAIAVVDSNLHREYILPSEKAFAYKMKSEAMQHQGKSTLGQVVPKWDDNRTTAKIGKDYGESYKTVQRYIRLTNLITQILDMVDEGRIAFTPAVYLSYLNEIEQQDLYEVIQELDATPNLSQAQKFKKMSEEVGLTPEYITQVLSQEKANQKERIKIPVERVRKFFPKSYTVPQMEEEIVKLCEARYKKRMRDRDSR